LFKQRQTQFEGSPALHRFSNILADDKSSPLSNPLADSTTLSQKDQATRASKLQVKHSIANLACGLTASEGKDKLLNMQRDFVAATAAGASTITEGPPGSPSESKTEESENQASPEPLVNVFVDSTLYVDIFRTILSGHHFNVDQRRLVHHLFRNADFGSKEKT
jgi:hypothetical protein